MSQKVYSERPFNFASLNKGSRILFKSLSVSHEVANKNFSKFQIFQAPIKFFSYVKLCYGEGIISHHLTFKNAKKEKLSNFDCQNMCKNTLNLKSENVLYLFPKKFSKIRLQIVSCRNRKSEPSIDGVDHICATVKFRCEKAAKVFFVK